MATFPWQAGQAPYVTPDQLYSPEAGGSQWPTGLQWGTIPDIQGATPAQQYAVIAMLCQQATTRAEQIVHFPLRSVSSTEELSGPHFRVTVQSASENGRIILSRWPVTQVLSVQTCPNQVWPRQWTALPAGSYEPEFPIPGLYGTSAPSGAGEGAQSILVQPGYINWCLGRQGWRVRINYIHGWPHAILTADAAAGAGTISVDDCTAWAPPSGSATGAAGIVYDALGYGQEPVTCTAASVAAGPGTLTLASPLTYAHTAGIMVSALPQGVIWATALLAAAAALTRGATATTIQTTGGRSQRSPGGGLEDQAKDLLKALRQTI